MNKFDQIQALLGLTEKEKSQILSINMANSPSRLYKEVWIGLGGTQSAVYATEVSAEEYLAYTTEETEKVEVYLSLIHIWPAAAVQPHLQPVCDYRQQRGEPAEVREVRPQHAVALPLLDVYKRQV